MSQLAFVHPERRLALCAARVGSRSRGSRRLCRLCRLCRRFVARGLGFEQDDRMTDQAAERRARLRGELFGHALLVFWLVKTHLDQLMIAQGAADGVDHRTGHAFVPDPDQRLQAVGFAAQVASSARRQQRGPRSVRQYDRCGGRGFGLRPRPGRVAVGRDALGDATRLLCARSGSRSGSRAGSRSGSRAGSRAGSPCGGRARL
jgi:hypothetical protein